MGNSFTIKITPPLAAGQTFHVELEANPAAFAQILGLFLPSSPPLPIPTMQAPQPTAIISAANGKAAKPSAPTTGKKKLVDLSCTWCGNKFMGRPEQKYHSEACREKAKRHARTEREAQKNGQQVEA